MEKLIKLVAIICIAPFALLFLALCHDAQEAQGRRDKVVTKNAYNYDEFLINVVKDCASVTRPDLFGRLGTKKCQCMIDKQLNYVRPADWTKIEMPEFTHAGVERITEVQFRDLYFSGRYRKTVEALRRSRPSYRTDSQKKALIEAFELRAMRIATKGCSMETTEFKDYETFDDAGFRLRVMNIALSDLRDTMEKRKKLIKKGKIKP